MKTNEYQKGLWQYPTMRDVAFEIIQCTPASDDARCHLQVMWWNVVKSHPPYCMNIVQSFLVTDKWMNELKRIP